MDHPTRPTAFLFYVTIAMREKPTYVPTLQMVLALVAYVKRVKKGALPWLLSRDHGEVCIC